MSDPAAGTDPNEIRDDVETDDAAEAAHDWDYFDRLERGEDPSGSDDAEGTAGDDTPSDEDREDDAGDASDFDDTDPGGADKEGDEEPSGAAKKDPGDSPADDDASGADDAPDAASEQDPLESIPEEHRASAQAAIDAVRADAEQERRRLEHQLQSEKGRVASFRRRAEEAEVRAQSPAQHGAGGEGGPDGEEGTAPITESDSWKALHEEYPDLTDKLGPIIQQFEQGSQRLATDNARMQRELSAIGDERRQQAAEEQYESLVEKHPDWLEVTQDANRFGAWLETQPRHIVEAAHRNSQGIVDAEEAADVIGRFKEHLGASGEPLPNAGSGGGKASGGDGSQGNNENPAAGDGDGNTQRSLSGRRQRQREGAAGVRTSTPGRPAASPPDDGDEGALWDYWDKVDAKQAARG